MIHSCDGCGKPISKVGFLNKVRVRHGKNYIIKHLCKNCKKPHMEYQYSSLIVHGGRIDYGSRGKW